MSALRGGVGLNQGENRAIRLALLVSIALHALLLFALPGLRESQQRRSIASEPLIARLLQPHVEPMTAPSPAIPEIRKPVLARAAKLAPTARTAPAPATTPPAAQVVSAAPELPNVDLAPAAPVGTVAPAALTSPVQVARVAPQSAPATKEALDTGTLAQYRLAIISAAKRYKRYPRAALDNNWQGRVEVRLTIGPAGAIAALSVHSSTGHPVLDQQALEMVERAKATAQIPPALRGREFDVDIPVIFSLREPDA